MKIVNILPKSGTRYKYRLEAILQEVYQINKRRGTHLFSDICNATGKSKMTIYRWRRIEHGDEEDIPALALKIIVFVLAKHGLQYSVDQLMNFEVVATTTEIQNREERGNREPFTMATVSK